MGRAGIVVVIAHSLVRLSGVVGKNIIPNFYGLVVSDVFGVVSSVLNVAFIIGEQCIAPSYLPVFTRAKESEGEARAWNFTSTLLNLQLIFLLAVVASFIFAPEFYVDLLTKWTADSTDAHDSEKRALFLKMLPFAAPGLIGLSIASLTYVILNSQKEFFFAAFGDTANKLAIVGGACIGYFLNQNDWRYVAGGAVAGGTVKLLTHLVALGPSRIRWYSLSMSIGDPYLREFSALALPLLFGIAVSQWRDLVMSKILTGEHGLQTFRDQGRVVIDSIQFIVPYAISVALLPFFCDLSARNDNEHLGELLTKVIRTIVWFFVPVSLALALAALPMSFVLFSGKALGKTELEFPAMVTRLYALQMPFAAIEMMCLQAFFSTKRVIAPTIAGLVFSVLAAGIAYYGVELKYVTSPMGILMLVSGCLVGAKVLKPLLLVAMLRMSLPVLPVTQTLGYVTKLLIAGVVAGALGWSLTRINFGSSWIRMALQTGIIGVTVFGAFLAVSLVLKMEEPTQMYAWTLEKMKRKGKPKA